MKVGSGSRRERSKVFEAREFGGVKRKGPCALRDVESTVSKLPCFSFLDCHGHHHCDTVRFESQLEGSDFWFICLSPLIEYSVCQCSALTKGSVNAVVTRPLMKISMPVALQARILLQTRPMIEV